MLTITILALLGSSAAQDEAPEASARQRFQDPRPPVLAVLAPLEPPPAQAFEGLVTHRQPRALAADARTEDWPSFLGPARDGRSRETRLLAEWGEDGPPLVWEMTRGEGFASPVVAGGRVVFTHRERNEVHIDCLEAHTGRRYWRRTFACDYRGRYISNAGPRSTPVIAGELVYVHGVDGLLSCLELSTGRVVWRRDLNEEFSIPEGFFGVVSSPLVRGDLLLQNIGAPGGPCVAAFDRYTGRLVWGSGDEWGASCASPVLATLHGRERLLVVGGGDSRPPTGGLMVIDPEGGALEFTYDFRSRTYESVNAACPLVDGERIFLTAAYGTGTVGLFTDADGGFQELWKNRHIGLEFSNLLLYAGRLWTVDGRSDRMGEVICIDPASGKELARTPIELEEEIEEEGQTKVLSLSIGQGCLLYADGRVLCLGDNGHLLWLELSPQGARVLARTWLFGANETWTPPVISQGLLYVCQNKRERFGDRPARLLCYDLRAAP